jgi:hypothetical protein
LRFIPFLRNAAILSKTFFLPILRATLIIPILTSASTPKTVVNLARSIFSFFPKRLTLEEIACATARKTTLDRSPAFRPLFT